MHLYCVRPCPVLPLLCLASPALPSETADAVALRLPTSEVQHRFGDTRDVQKLHRFCSSCSDEHIKGEEKQWDPGAPQRGRSASVADPGI